MARTTKRKTSGGPASGWARAVAPKSRTERALELEARLGQNPDYDLTLAANEDPVSLLERLQSFPRLTGKSKLLAKRLLELATLQARIGNYEAAISTYAVVERLTRKVPNEGALLTRAALNRTWIFATCPVDCFRNGRAAQAIATRTIVRTRHQNASAHLALSAAFAELSEFPRALRSLEDAKGAHPATHLITELEQRFREGQPYRDQRVVRLDGLTSIVILRDLGGVKPEQDRTKQIDLAVESLTPFRDDFDALARILETAGLTREAREQLTTRWRQDDNVAGTQMNALLPIDQVVALSPADFFLYFDRVLQPDNHAVLKKQFQKWLDALSDDVRSFESIADPNKRFEEKKKFARALNYRAKEISCQFACNACGASAGLSAGRTGNSVSGQFEFSHRVGEKKGSVGHARSTILPMLRLVPAS
jgi:tetratricopeptide (TPR) repeat protein